MGNITIFRASPRKNGNTNALADVACARLREKLAAGTPATSKPPVIREFNLYDMDIRPCLACRQCQKDWTQVSCAREDDMQQIFEAVCDSDLLILASPVYSWYCTPPMKAMLDRLVYAMNMYYGEERGPSLWKGKRLALITTCGYPPEKGADLLDEGIRRYCKHSQLRYEGMLCARHMGYGKPFMDEDKQKQAIAFADLLLGEGEDKGE